MLAQTAASGAPWWGTALIAGGFVIIGALITKGIDLLNARRTRKDRWLDYLREYAIEMLTATNLHPDIAEARNEEATQASLSRMALAAGSLALVATQEVRDLSEDLIASALELGIVLTKPSASADKRLGQMKAHGHAYNAFLEAVRNQLGVKVA